MDIKAINNNFVYRMWLLSLSKLLTQGITTHSIHVEDSCSESCKSNLDKLARKFSLSITMYASNDIVYLSNAKHNSVVITWIFTRTKGKQEI